MQRLSTHALATITVVVGTASWIFSSIFTVDAGLPFVDDTSAKYQGVLDFLSELMICWCSLIATLSQSLFPHRAKNHFEAVVEYLMAARWGEGELAEVRVVVLIDEKIYSDKLKGR